MAEIAQENLLEHVLRVGDAGGAGQRKPVHHIAPAVDHLGALFLCKGHWAYLLSTSASAAAPVLPVIINTLGEGKWLHGADFFGNGG